MAETTAPPFTPIKQFKWETLTGHIQKQGLLKYKSQVKKSWEKRWLVLHYNYVLIFKTAKEPVKKDEPKSLIELELVDSPRSIEVFREEKIGGAFVIHASGGKDHYIMTDDVPTMQGWMTVLQQQVEKLKSAENRENTDRMLDRLNSVKRVFKENALRTPKTVKAAEAEEWFNDIKMYKEEYKKWTAFVSSCALWSEVMTSNEDNARYVKWFSNKSTGVWEQLNSSENSVLINWNEAITKSSDTLQDALEKNFFSEDMKKPISEAELFKKLIGVYQEAKKTFQGDNTVYFAQEKQRLEQIIGMFQAMPSLRDVSFDKYEGGSVRTDQLLWVYDKFGAVLKNENISAQIVEPVVWDCKEAHVLKNQVYGFVIWNTKSWVWTHPKIPYIIRYDFETARSVFQQVMPPKDPTGKKKMPPSLTDWQIKEDGIQAVTVGKKDTPPAVPPDIFWTTKGKLPPPIALTVVTFHAIKAIVRGP